MCIGGQRQEAGTATRGHKREGQLVGLRTEGRRGFNTEEKAKGGKEEKKTGCQLQTTVMELFRDSQLSFQKTEGDGTLTGTQDVRPVLETDKDPKESTE